MTMGHCVNIPHSWVKCMLACVDTPCHWVQRMYCDVLCLLEGCEELSTAQAAMQGYPATKILQICHAGLEACTSAPPVSVVLH